MVPTSRPAACSERMAVSRPEPGTLDEHVDLLHAVFLRLAGRVLGGHLSGERRRLARALEAHVPGRGPGDDGTLGIGDRDDRVVERALDVSVAVRDVLLLLAPDLLGPRRYVPWVALLLTNLLLTGDGLLRTLARASVGLRPLAVHWQAATVTNALVAADLDLAADVGGDLTAEVTFDLEVRVDVVAQGDEVEPRSGRPCAGPG